jgi:hypothetical protein
MRWEEKRLTTDGTFFYMTHLDGFNRAVRSGSAVRQGDVIGYVGSTGNAGVPHLHIQVHPRGGNPVNPRPYLDQWFSEAMDAGSARLAAHHEARRMQAAAAVTRAAAASVAAASPAVPARDPVADAVAAARAVIVVVAPEFAALLGP